MKNPIRSAEPEDAADLTRLLQATNWFERFNIIPQADLICTVKTHLEQCIRNGESHSIYVSEGFEGGLDGYIAVHWLPYLFLPGPEGYISELFVLPEVRGKGIGAALLDAVKQEAYIRGCSRLSLINGKQRESYQRAFYSKQGWEERPMMANFVFRFPSQEK